MHISMEIIALMRLYSDISEHGYFIFTEILIIGSTGFLFMMITLMHTDKIMAATSSGYAANGVQKNVTEYLPTGQNGENTTVGRYALNYTGMRIREVIL